MPGAQVPVPEWVQWECMYYVRLMTKSQLCTQSRRPTLMTCFWSFSYFPSSIVVSSAYEEGSFDVHIKQVWRA